MKRVLLALFVSVLFLSGCSQPKQPEPGSALPSFEAYRRTQDVKGLSNDYNEQVQEAIDQ